MLTTALGMAVRLEMLERSPMDRVTPPKKKEARFSFYSPGSCSCCSPPCPAR